MDKIKSEYHEFVVKKNCRHYLGDRPCDPHKKLGKKCSDCNHFVGRDKRIAIIKLGSIGDVIRTTPLIRKLKEVYPNSELTWITHSPEVIPKTVDHVLKLEPSITIRVLAEKYDLLYNLDKDIEACALTNIINADEKKGFALKDGKCEPIDDDAVHKHATGLDDDLSRQNTKNYPEEIFEIAGFPYQKEEYVVDLPELKIILPQLKKPTIGLNTGCSDRWPTRNWPTKYWIELSQRLIEEGYSVLLLGGKLEHTKNLEIAKESGAYYHGIFPIQQFMHLINISDVIVTPVTMAMHIAIGLKKNIILFNNIFNKHEFEFYGRGLIIEPNIKCVGCYKTKFDDDCPVKNCMELVKVDEVVEAVKNFLKK